LKVLLKVESGEERTEDWSFDLKVKDFGSEGEVKKRLGVYLNEVGDDLRGCRHADYCLKDWLE
jgi:hypothetical protein